MDRGMVSRGSSILGMQLSLSTIRSKRNHCPLTCLHKKLNLKLWKRPAGMQREKLQNIYTDSRYAFGITHDYGPIWKARDFLTANGKPIKNRKGVKALMDALLLPTRVAIMKMKGHSSGKTLEARGNHRADLSAKAAAQKPRDDPVGIAAVQQQISLPVNYETFKTLQSQATKEEKAVWLEKGAVMTPKGTWELRGKLCLPRALFPVTAQATHGNTHLSKTAMTALVNNHWYAPGFTQACMICAHHNIGRTVKTPLRHTPRPDFPFQRLQIDYIQLPKVGTLEYVLVCVDLFSGWPEAYPVAKATAQNTAKKLLNEIVCWYGVPETIESDRGSHFTGEVMREIMGVLGIEQAFHTAYHPQSSGRVQRLNGTIKSKIQKAMAELKKPWTECLPLALFSTWYTPTGRQA
ncbi:uncharacterized protein LOC120986370 [Bufo bufo]|uniref:uncharacterized protein LOC120986370 n=1 Tax=Bufo bufo TaxID=8384 RepID=UPI001ABE127D|nr:uncharacterized protein LOC120986370 [Bufo bufo]